MTKAGNSCYIPLHRVWQDTIHLRAEKSPPESLEKDGAGAWLQALEQGSRWRPERKRVACKTLYLVDIRNQSDGRNSRRPEKRKRYNHRLDMISSCDSEAQSNVFVT